MKLGYALINEENREFFDRVFPTQIELVPFRVAVGAVDEEGRVLGAVSYILANYEYSLDWLFVEPQVRRQGIGTGLIEQVCRTLTHTGDLFPLTARFEFSAEDDEMHTFFLSIKHFVTSYSHDRYYVTKEDLREAEGLRKTSKSNVEAERFFDKSESEQKKILNFLRKEQTYDVADYERWKKTCVPELCKCVFARNTLVDLIFVQRTTDGNLELSYLYGKYPQGLIELITETVRELELLFPDNCLSFEALNDASVKLAEHLFPKAKKAHVYETEF